MSRKIYRVVRVNPVEDKPRRVHRVVRVNPHIAADSPMMMFQQYVAQDLNKAGALTPSTRFRETKIAGRTALSVTGVDPYLISKDLELLARLTRLARNSGLEFTPGAGSILFSQPYAREARPNPTFPKGNFERCVAEVSARGGAVEPKAVCAATMRRAYGSSFQKAAIRGRRAAMRNPVRRSSTSEPKHRAPADMEGARELVLFATNDGEIYRQRTKYIIQNLARKQIKGTYDPKLAVKLWLYWADDAAKKYAKEFGGTFSPATRWEAARMAVDEYAEELAMTRAEMSKGKARKNPLTPAQKRRMTIARKRGPSGRL